MEKKSFAQKSLGAVQEALESVSEKVTLDDFYSITVDTGVALQGYYKAELAAALKKLVNNLSANECGYLVGGYYLTLPIEENEETQSSVFVRIILT